MGHFVEHLVGDGHLRGGFSISGVLVVGGVDWVLGDDQAVDLGGCKGFHFSSVSPNSALLVRIGAQLSRRSFFFWRR